MLRLIRAIIGAIYLCFVGALGVIGCLFRPFNPSNAWPFAKLIGRPGLFLLGIKFKVNNYEIMKDNRPCIFIANHQHNLDVFAYAALTPFRTVSVGKRSIIKVPFFGLFYWLTGNVLIDRKRRHKALRSMGKVEEAIKDKNASLWILPEGTRSGERGLLPFKKGAFHSAINVGCPIVPVCLSSYHKNLDFNRLHSGTILVDVLDPIETKDMTSDDVNSLRDHCYEIIKKRVHELDLELESTPTNLNKTDLNNESYRA